MLCIGLMNTFLKTPIICSSTANASKRTVLSTRISKSFLLKVRRPYSSHVVHDGRPFRLAVLGSGPAGFYTAYKVMSTIGGAVVDMYEHLPVPFGLVRYGVAPDHPEVKVNRRWLLYSNLCLTIVHKPESLSSN